ncbi:MAG: hypothetical protein IJ205_06660 [Bacteroidales bacterium]|nr:hypothetical protein [Bacteroidales bacterium]
MKSPRKPDCESCPLNS